MLLIFLSNSQQKCEPVCFPKFQTLPFRTLQQFSDVSCRALLPKILIYVLRFIKSLLSYFNLWILYSFGCCSSDAWPRLFHTHQVHVARHFAAVTSGLDFIFSDIQNLANMCSRVQRAKHVCAVSACAPMGTDFGKEMNNWPTSVSTTSLWLTCSHATAFYGLSPDAALFLWREEPCNSIYELRTV